MSQPQSRLPLRFLLLLLFFFVCVCDIFRWALSTILERKAGELFLFLLILPLQCGESRWAGASVRHRRPQRVGVGLRVPLRGEPVTQVIEELVTRDSPSWLLFLDGCRSVLSLERSHNILLSIVEAVFTQRLCLVRLRPLYLCRCCLW